MIELLSNVTRAILVHPFWDFMGIVGAIIVVAKILHPRVNFP